jgi:two-component system chemotaxis sensor kinase CheA
MRNEGEANLQDYLGEAEDIFERLQEGVSDWQGMLKRGEMRREAVDDLFRHIHSLKGLSSSFALLRSVELCQLIEQILRLARTDTSFIDKEKLGVITDLIDDLYKETEAISRGERSRIKIDAKKQLVEKILAQEKRIPYVPAKTHINISNKILKSLTNLEEERLFSDIEQGKKAFLCEITASAKELRKIITNFTSAIKKEESVIAHLLFPLEKKSGYIKVLYLVTTDYEDFANSIKRRIPKFKLHIKTLKQRKAATEPSKVKTKEPSMWTYPKKFSQTIRVDIKRLNRLQEALAELLLSKAHLEDINIRHYKTYGYDSFFRENSQAIDVFERKLRYLQERIIESRLVPIAQIFNKLDRIISKVLPDSGKKVELTTSGSETELDGALVEQLADPLMHIIRNAIDHGIETNDVRKQKEKDEVGRIFLRAYPRGSRIVIEVEDDGQGMDSKKIRQKAIEMGFLKSEEVVSENDILKMIFMPGFSTKESLSQVSGMGVGMDVVKKSIVKLGGSVDIHSIPDKGTKFTIVVPITLAIIRVALVEVSSHILAIPMVSVIENLRLSQNMIKCSNGNEMIHYRNHHYPLLNLRKEFKIKEFTNSKGGELAIVVGVGDDKICLRVDTLLEQRDVIIMPVGRLLSCIPGLAGAAEIGRRKIALVLDMSYFVSRGTAMLEQEKKYGSINLAEYQKSSNSSFTSPFQSEHKALDATKEMKTSKESAEKNLDAVAKYLTFYINSTPFAVDCASAQEVVKGLDVTPLFLTKTLIAGISRIRSKVVPVLNLKSEHYEPFNRNNLVIVVNYNRESIGLCTEQVGAIVSADTPKIYKSKEKFTKGRFKFKRENYNILDLDRIMDLGEKDICL